MSAPVNRLDKLLRQGELQFNTGDVAAAEQAFAEAARLAPDAWQIHFNLGMCRDRLGRHEGAFTAYEAAHRLAPDHLPSLTNLAVNAFNLGKIDLALQLTLRQLELEPGNALAYDNLGQIFRQLRQYEASELSFRNALILNPTNPSIHNNLGLVLQDQNKLEAAESAFLTALEHDAKHVDGYTNLGCLHLAAGRIEEALAHYRKAVELAPESAIAWTNLGNALKASGDYDDALKAHQRAVGLSPQYPLAHWNYGLSLLAMGRFDEGWKEYEWGAAAGARSRFSNHLPRWQGESLRGRRLLLRTEQGLGDTLQFVRFARLLQADDVHVTLECQPALVTLLTGTAGIDRVVARDSSHLDDTFGCDLFLPLMSLPLMLGISLADLPGPVPYLRAPPERRTHVLRESSRLRVGVVWAGNRLHRDDRQRSCPLADLAPLLAVPEIDFVSLQMGGAVQALPEPLFDATRDIRDFADTAALLEHLDLVISVDTALVHLAGALSKPAWLMLARNSDWRWLHDRNDSPWYPTLKLYRQKMPGQWLPVVERLAADLAKLAAKHAKRHEDT